MSESKSARRIENLPGALALFMEKFGGRFVRNEQGVKGPVCFVLSDSNENKVYLFFKRDWLHRYGQLFPNETWGGWGQTVNYEVLKKAASEDAIIIVITPDGAFYSCMAADWLRYAEEHKTIRRPREEVSLEASIPAKMVKRVLLA